MCSSPPTLLPVEPAAGAEAVAGRAGYSVGLFDPASGAWYLRDQSGHTTRLGTFGGAGNMLLAGDWDGDGVDTSLYRPATGRLVVRNGPEPISFIYPISGDGLPVSRGRHGRRRQGHRLSRRSGRLYILDGLGQGPASLQGPDPLPIVLPAGIDALVGGDFDGDGVDEVAAVHDGTVEMVGASRRVTLGYIGKALPVAGDWDGDGVFSVAGYDSWRAQFRFLAAGGEAAPAPLAYGSTGMLPVAGDFGDLPGRDSPPMHRAGLPPMREGDEGPEVVLLQQELARHDLFRGGSTASSARPRPTPSSPSTRRSGWSGPGAGKRPIRGVWPISYCRPCRSARASRTGSRWTSAARSSTSSRTAR